MVLVCFITNCKLMASIKVLFQFPLICFFFHLHVQPLISYDLDTHMLSSCKIDKIYQLGDSYMDTGNYVVEEPSSACGALPYGETTFLGPTGRCSDGLLTIDYIAIAAGIPFLNPYLQSNANFSHGVNFAVSSSTALSPHILTEKNITLPGTKSSLGVQLEWMSDHLASQCHRDINCINGSLKNALFIVGIIGSNDYNFALVEGKSTEEVQYMVPEVVETIKDAIRRVIGLGAARVIVPGHFPAGCIPLFLHLFKSDDTHQCLKEYNDLAARHNDYLQQAISTLQEENPATTIVYADYYNAFMWLLHRAPLLGLDANNALKGCCGGNLTFESGIPINGCGDPGVPVCSNPEQYISWDGVHMTQKANSLLSKWLLADIVPKLNCHLQVVDF